MQAALSVHDQLGHAGDRHTHQAVAPAGGSANVERPRQEAAQLEIHSRDRVGKQLRNSFTEQFAPRFPIPLQKAGTCVLGEQIIPWQSLGKCVRQPWRPQVAKQHLVEVADGRVDVLLRRLELAKLVRGGVLRDELMLLGHVLQSDPGSLELHGCDTSCAARGCPVGPVQLTALHRDEAERTVEAVYLRRCVLLAERQEQLAQRHHFATADPLVPALPVQAWAGDTGDLLVPIGTQGRPRRCAAVVCDPANLEVYLQLEVHRCPGPAEVKIGLARWGSVGTAVPLLREVRAGRAWRRPLQGPTRAAPIELHNLAAVLVDKLADGKGSAIWRR